MLKVLGGWGFETPFFVVFYGREYVALVSMKTCHIVIASVYEYGSSWLPKHVRILCAI